MEPVDINQIKRDSTTKSMEKLADSSRHIKAADEALNGLTGALKASQSAASLLGIESDKLARAQENVKTATELTQGVQKVANVLDKESYFNLVIVSKAKDLLTAANTRLATALGISTGAARALMGTLTLGLSVAVTASIIAWDKYTESREKASEKVRQQLELERSGRAQMVQTQAQLEQTKASIKGFNGTKEQEAKLLGDLNNQYGETFGNYKSIAKWYDVLSAKGEAYIQTLFLQAKAQSFINKAVDADARVNEIKAKPESDYSNILGRNGKENKAKELKEAERLRNLYKNQALATSMSALTLQKSTGIGTYAPPPPKTSPNTTSTKENQEEVLKQKQEKQNEWDKRIGQSHINALKEIENHRLETLQEGDEKRKELAGQQFDEELERIEQQRLIRLEEVKNAREQGAEVSPKQLDAIDNDTAQQTNQAAAQYTQEMVTIEEEANRKKEENQLRYLKAYGTYQEQLSAIEQEYKNKREKVTDSYQLAALYKEEEAAKEALSKSMLQETDLWTRLFEDASQHTASYIEKTIKQARILLEYLENIKQGKNVELPKELGTDITPEKVKSMKSDDVKKVISTLDQQSATLSKKNPFKGMVNGFKDLKDAGSDTEKQFAATQNIIGNLQGATAVVSQVGGAVSQMGGSAGKTMSKVAGVASSTLSMASTGASIGGPWGAAIGGALGLASGLVGAMGADYSEYDAMVQKYDVLMGVWDQLLTKKQAYIKESYGAEATKAGEEALTLLNAEENVSKALAQKRLSSGSSSGSHSMEYRMWKGSYKWEGQNWRDVARDISQQLGGVEFKGMSDMLNMSGEQLEWIKTNYSGLWASMEGDFRGYLDKIIQYGETEKQIIATTKEQITGISLEGFKDSYLSLMTDLDSTNQDFAKNLEGYLRKSILQSVMDKKFKQDITDLYDSWSESGKDGKFSKEEVKALREKEKKLSEAMIAERDRLMTDLELPSDTASSQSGQAGAINTVTEETAGKLEGIGLSIQTHIISMDEKMADLTRYSYQAIGLLGNIAENTSYCRCLEEIAQIVTKMERDGMKIKG